MFLFTCRAFSLPAQVQAPRFKRRKDPPRTPATIAGPSSAPPTITRNAASHRNRRHHLHQSPHSARASVFEDAEEGERWGNQRRSHRSGSMFSLPNLGSASFRSTCSSPGPTSSPHHRSHSLQRSNSLVPPFRLNVDALIGAEETDVDTGDRVNPGSGVDLSVVSAYLKSGLLQTSRPLSAPPVDIETSQSPAVPAENSFKAATLGRTLTVFSAVGGCSLSGTRASCTNVSVAPSLSDVSLNHSDSCSLISATIEEVDKFEEQEEEEFYI